MLNTGTFVLVCIMYALVGYFNRLVVTKSWVLGTGIGQVGILSFVTTFELRLASDHHTMVSVIISILIIPSKPVQLIEMPPKHVVTIAEIPAAPVSTAKKEHDYLPTQFLPL